VSMSKKEGRYVSFWHLSTFAVTRQFVCNWGQTGPIIGRLNTVLMTLTRLACRSHGTTR
jgi:hypothetical protein